ncbi:MAG: NapC/NirT family cytochrome c [Candidatus Zixiibacteriota bacterium]
MVAKKLTSNYISYIGLLIVSISAIIIVFILTAEWMGFEFNPYIGVVSFLVLPAIMAVGVILIPVGKAWERRRAGRPVGYIKIEIDLEQARTRRRILSFVAIGTAVFAFVGATVYQSVLFMDTTQFCGEVCHSVMEPELTSYRNSPHARVPCVECHIGEGANWYVKSKLSGLGQVVAVTFDTYDRPIPTPIENLRPARETCEQCHWPEKFHSSKLVVNSHFREDSANSMYKNVLLMKTGGGSAHEGGTEGIHWHMNIKNRIEYVAADKERDTILYIHMTDLEGRQTEFVYDNTEIPIDSLRKLPRRVMDCMDCHNRPSHTYEVPEVAVDLSLVTGEISTDLPYIKREGVRIITEPYESQEAAERDIRTKLRAFYHKEFPTLAASRAADIEKAADVLTKIYKRNVFPRMNIEWGTYPNFIGHTYSNGCFRCHDEEHTSPEGLTISQDCGACHTLLAWEEEDPKPVLEELPNR